MSCQEVWTSGCSNGHEMENSLIIVKLTLEEYRGWSREVQNYYNTVTAHQEMIMV